MDSSSSVSVQRKISAPAEVVFALITDLPRMGEWSPENDGGRWTKGATVTAYSPNSEFAFSVNKPIKVADWAYRIEPVEDGCVVTETWTDRRGWLIRKLGKPVSGVADRATHNRAGMEATLAALAATAEGR